VRPHTPPAKVTYFDSDGQVSYVADDGTRQTLPEKNIDRVAFSSSGQVAYITQKPNHGARWLWISDSATTPGQRQPAPCHGCAPGFGLTWSNDGTRLAYPVFTAVDGSTQLVSQDVSTGQKQVISLPIGCEARAPRFSPDDRKLAINVTCGSDAYVATVDPDAGNSSLTPLSGTHSQVQLPSWSTDGQTVYFTATTSGEDTNDVNGRIDLFAVGADGTDLRQITHAAEGERFYGATPYGNQFLINRAMGNGPWQVGWLSADGTTFTPMKDAAGNPVQGGSAQLQP
jgi:dipeptidyl aminopeptidase/acylaminoacyl peptidase